MIYLDNAATTLKKPDCVVAAVTNALCNMGNSSRGTHDSSLKSARAVFSARLSLAKLFNAPGPEQVVFTQNSTEALNIAISGLFSRGDHVITTDLEHNSVLRPLYRLEDEGVITLSVVSADKQGCVDYADFARLIRKETRAIVCTHASNLTGNMIDIGKVGTLAKEIGEIMGVTVEEGARKIAQVKCTGGGHDKTRYDYVGLSSCLGISRVSSGPLMCSYGCLGGGDCVAACKFDAIAVVDGVAKVDFDKCVACGACVDACPKHIIEIVPLNAKKYTELLCSSHDKGPAVRAACDNGCIGCKLCVKACPKEGAITVDNFLAKINYDICIGCGLCSRACPRQLITVDGKVLPPKPKKEEPKKEAAPAPAAAPAEAPKAAEAAPAAPAAEAPKAE